MPTTKNYARGRVWQDTERIAMTLRVPKPMHDRITRAALEREMTINDLMLAILDYMLTTQRSNHDQHPQETRRQSHRHARHA